MKSKALRLIPLLVLISVVGLALLWGQTQDQSQQGQSQDQNQGQTQTQQDQSQQQQPQKKRGLFSGLKAVTGQSSEQTEATASAGSKSVGEGQRIGNVQPTAQDRIRVSAMEGYLIPAQELKKFQQEGQLTPAK